MTNKLFSMTPEELYHEATAGQDLSDSALRLLASGFIALKQAQTTPMSDIEFRALSGVVSYVAYTQKIRRESVEDMLKSYFGLDAIRALPSRSYQRAIDFLIELESKQQMN